MNLSKALQAAIMLPVMAGPVMAQQPRPTSSSTMPMASAADTRPSTKAFKAADDKMMRGMDRPMTGNADQDFVAGMLPHHAGAVGMAKVELRYGKDPEMLRLARGIINAQQKEIAQMQVWQAKHPEH
ncbi:CopM family metallochaperone [Lichenicoccus sp.]|uniref:CopM family metallochaperone n=1 Tax=Lichenicoccus sp. TaxID=2781899 RepID=UPI003D116A6C